MKNSELLDVMFEYCPTGSGGGVDPTCSPGGTRRTSSPSSPFSQSSARVAELTRERDEIQRILREQLNGPPPYRGRRAMETRRAEINREIASLIGQSAATQRGQRVTPRRGTTRRSVPVDPNRARTRTTTSRAPTEYSVSTKALLRAADAVPFNDARWTTDAREDTITSRDENAWNARTPGWFSSVYTFRVGEQRRKFEVKITGETLSFFDDRGSISRTGKGDAVEVFRNVNVATIAYVKEKKPEMLRFSAVGDSRVKLYSRLSARLGELYPGSKVQIKTSAGADTGEFRIKFKYPDQN